METRKEKYRKYREEIVHMADEFFPSESEKRYRISQADEKILTTAKRAGNSISFGEMLQGEVEENDSFNETKSVSPYVAYRQRKSKALIFKFVALVAVTVALTIWYFLIKGRL